MMLGTAGYTAMLCVRRLEAQGIRPDNGPVLVTGANGGVGGAAIVLLARRGYEVVASTGRADAHERLKGLGAQRIIDRSEEHTSELQSLMRISYAVFCLKKKKNTNTDKQNNKHRNSQTST